MLALGQSIRKYLITFHSRVNHPENSLYPDRAAATFGRWSIRRHTCSTPHIDELARQWVAL